MQKTLRAAGMLALVMSAALVAAVSLKTYTGSGALILSIPLASINKMTFDDFRISNPLTMPDPTAPVSVR
jgi:hypothetical protein